MRGQQAKAKVINHSVGNIWLRIAPVALVGLFLLALPQLFSPQATGSVTQGFLFTVTTTDDHNDFVCDGTDCTLREAIQAANNAPTEDTIDFSVTGTINLLSALPNITDSVSIEGPGADMLTVRRSDSAASFRIIEVMTTGTVTISGLTITRGASIGNLSPAGGIRSSGGALFVTNCIISGNSGGAFGGGVTNSSGTLTVTDSIVSDNSSIGIYNTGTALTVINSTVSGNVGGITQEGSSALTVTSSSISDNHGRGITSRGNSTLTVINSTISGNISTQEGGGIDNEGGALTVTNSTISGNHAKGFGAGIMSLNDSSLTITNSTISGNTITGPTGNMPTNGGGILYAGNDPASIKSSIVALNSAEDSPDVGGRFNSGGFNLIGKTDGSLGFTHPTDLIGTMASPLDPGLDPDGLQDNGGPTKTIALLCGSPAIDKGTSVGLTGNLTTDQRGTGFPRTIEDILTPNAEGGDGTDIGAFELMVCNHSPVALCKNIQVAVDANCQAMITVAQIDNGSFDPDSGDSVVYRTLNTTGPFGPGQHTVTLTVTDMHGASRSCTATVTVVDTTPPVITCPANIIIKTAGTGATVTVTYPPPTTTDNCPGVTFACSPPSGSQFPLGATTVTCTATDAAGNSTSCTFVVTVFDVCLQDDTTRSVLFFNSQTGDYLFAKCGAGSFSLSGRGQVRIQGGIITLEQYGADRRVTARIDNGIKRGTAAIQYFPLGTTFTITDRNTADNSCVCP